MNLLFPFSKCLLDWLSVIICVLVYDHNWKLLLLAMLNTGKCIMWHLKSPIYSFCVYFVRCRPSLPSKTPKLLLLRYVTYPCLSNLKVADLCMDGVLFDTGKLSTGAFFLKCWEGCAFGSGSALTQHVFGDVFVMLMCSGCLWQSSKHNRFSRITLCWGKCLMFAFWVHKDIIKASQPTVCIRVSKQYHHFSIAMNESAKVESLVECSWSTISYFPNGADPFPLKWYFHNG
jgi:uncharacterized protein YhhL (DUF1145 family)